MGRGHYRTYCLTGSVVTMLAGHRLEGNFRIVCRYLEFFVGLSSRWRAVIAVNSNPCHFTAVENFLLTDYGYVILDLTSYSTGTKIGRAACRERQDSWTRDLSDV